MHTSLSTRQPKVPHSPSPGVGASPIAAPPLPPPNMDTSSSNMSNATVPCGEDEPRTGSEAREGVAAESSANWARAPESDACPHLGIALDSLLHEPRVPSARPLHAF